MTGRLDIAMLPSLSRLETVSELFAGYGLAIVDECHHVPAVSFEALLKACPCRRVIGLTATPQRKDGLERLLHLQCGPIRHTVEVPASETVLRTVFVRRSSFHRRPRARQNRQSTKSGKRWLMTPEGPSRWPVMSGPLSKRDAVRWFCPTAKRIWTSSKRRLRGSAESRRSSISFGKQLRYKTKTDSSRRDRRAIGKAATLRPFFHGIVDRRGIRPAEPRHSLSRNAAFVQGSPHSIRRSAAPISRRQT
jgi:Type III restriction enzyme, res subunit